MVVIMIPMMNRVRQNVSSRVLQLRRTCQELYVSKSLSRTSEPGQRIQKPIEYVRRAMLGQPSKWLARCDTLLMLRAGTRG